MIKRGKRRVFLIVVILLFAFVLLNVSFDKIYSLPDGLYLDYNEIQSSNQKGDFGKLVSMDLKQGEIDTATGRCKDGVVVFKLFGLIPIKKVSVKIFPEEDVYVGGSTIGLNVTTNGVMVISNYVVDSESGCSFKQKQIESGDIIQKCNGVAIENINDLICILNDVTADNVGVSLLRGNRTINVSVPLIKSNNQYKLGLWVRDNISGVGTLTFVDKNKGTFGALGHAITNGHDDSALPISCGEVYLSNLVHIEKGEKNKPGELQCVFLERNKLGNVQKNTQVGVFGKLDDMHQIIDENKSARLGGRLSVKPGAAKLISCVSGIREEYDIEIIKVSNQKQCGDKSFIFRVKDKRLLNLTGGIVQGMSGSPIMQNDRIVGAVTHVFVSDATKGYGVFTDWMLEQLTQVI